MGINVYMTYAASKGYTTAGSATPITVDIDGRSGERIAIIAFGATASNSSDKVYFMQPLAATTISEAVLSGASTVMLAALPSYGSNAIASGDLLAITMDDGSFHFSLLAGSAAAATSNWAITDALDDDLAVGNAVYWFGLHSDSGHLVYQLAGSTQSTEQNSGGFFFGSAKGYPMRVYNENAGSIVGGIDYISIAYINK